MNTSTNRLVTGVLAVLIAGSTLAAPAFAATGNQGYAVYRDGVVFNLTWHGALMDDPHWNTTSLPVVQAIGSSGNVKWDTWKNFLGGKAYMGTYRPKAIATSVPRDNFVYMGRRLKDDQIPYSLLYQVEYNTRTSGNWVEPDEVTTMRCDGVVEYVYEWYGFRVFGSDSRWDVTKVDFWNREAHGSGNVTPKSQAQNYLTKVSSSLP